VTGSTVYSGTNEPSQKNVLKNFFCFPKQLKNFYKQFFRAVILESRHDIPSQEISLPGVHQRGRDGVLGDVLDSIDRIFYSAIDGIITFEIASRMGMCWSHCNLGNGDPCQKS
jgi:hypothetical protein